jgi:hypothetical protein
MNKKEMAILEAAFEDEISSAIGHRQALYQSKSKIAEKLADEGFLERATVKFGAVECAGYRLTHAGRLTYCMTCEEAP